MSDERPIDREKSVISEGAPRSAREPSRISNEAPRSAREPSLVNDEAPRSAREPSLVNDELAAAQSGRAPVEMVIPADRLPQGFAQRIGESVAEAAVPQRAATAVLMRDGANGIEVLLLKRHRASGFVPGAYVFAGGRVDAADGADALIEYLESESSASGAAMPGAPPIEYWLTAIRELFEESGVLLAKRSIDARAQLPDVRIDYSSATRGAPTEHSAVMLAELREALMTERATLLDVLQQLDAFPDFDAMAYAAHWITPLAESRRYDTRFFYAAMPPGATATSDEREMSDAVWLTADEALERFRAGQLPMVFPTVRTLQDLRKYRTVRDAFDGVRGMTIEPILPTLVRVDGGVGIVIDAGAPRIPDKDEAGE